MSIASSEAQFIVELKKIRQPNRLPASHQAGSTLAILFGSVGFNIELTAV